MSQLWKGGKSIQQRNQMKKLNESDVEMGRAADSVMLEKSKVVAYFSPE